MYIFVVLPISMNSNMNKSDRSKVKRAPKRGHYDQKTIHEILDASQICHVAFVHSGYPVSIPTIFGRSGNKLYLHGASTSRMMVDLEKGIAISLMGARAFIVQPFLPLRRCMSSLASIARIEFLIFVMRLTRSSR